MVEKCVVCDKNIESDRRVVREKELQGLLKASIRRRDGMQSRLRGKCTAVAHISCQASNLG